MGFVGTSFSASDCVVEFTISCLLGTNSTVSLCKCISLHKEVLSLFSFLQVLWRPLGVLAEGNADKKYMTCFGHMFTSVFMLRNGPSILCLSL